MATIHWGRWTGGARFRKVVAIKALHAHLSRDQRLRDMLRDEARMLARIRHPNVLQTIDVVESDEHVFMVTDYIHGATLAQLSRKADRTPVPVPIGIALRIVSDTLHGLHAAHEACDENGDPLRIVHRDVSPQNVLVGVDGHARLIDFGVALARGRITHTRTGEIKGKMAYVAPEQLGDAEVDRRADVYGASVVLWQALTGRKLFDATDYAQLFAAILREPVAPPSTVNEVIGAELDAIVMRGLARDPERRFATAQDMAEALDALAAHAPRRRVAAWVQHTARARLDAMASTVHAIERAAPLPFGSVTRRLSLIDPEELSETVPTQPTRTQLTSLADATPTHNEKDSGALSWVAGVGVLSLVLAIWLAALSRPPPEAGATTVPAESAAEFAEDETPATSSASAAPETPPPPAAGAPSATPSASASSTPPRAPHRYPRRRVPDWIPDGI